MPSLVNQKTIRQFEKEDQDALIKYLVQSVIKRNEFNMEPFTNSLKRLTLDNADCEKTQEKVICFIIAVFLTCTKTVQNCYDQF